MGSVELLRTPEEIDFTSKVLGGSFWETKSFDNLKEAIRIDAAREANTRLLAKFDAFCNERGLKYFLYEESLQGALAYHDFIPGACDLNVGMLRADYDALIAACDKATEEQRKKWGFHLDYLIPDTKFKRIYLQVIANKSKPVYRDGDLVYDDESMPMMAQGAFDLAVFDAVPDDFFTRKKFFRQVKRRNDFYKRALLARGIEPAPYLYLNQSFGIRHRIVPAKISAWIMHHIPKKYKGRKSEYVVRLAGWRSPMLPTVDLGDFPYMKFRDIEVRTPANPGLWASEPIMETTEELKRLQSDAKEIVQEIDRVCGELGISYFACGGTMLGDVRHGGFIPWDDDIDVGMLRADYEVFKARANEFLDKERFFLQTRETDPNIPYLFTKVRMNGTEYLTSYNIKRDFHKGICVDVFPFDYVPNPGKDLFAFKDEVIAASKAHNRVVNRQYPEYYEKSEPDRRNLDWLIGQAVGRMLARRYWGISLNDTQRCFDETVQRNNATAKERKLKYVACFVPSYTMAKLDDLLPYQRIEFDGIDINIPAHPEKFLRMQYGDYMVEPYPHQRAGHDLLLWSDAEGVGGGRQMTDK